MADIVEKSKISGCSEREAEALLKVLQRYIRNRFTDIILSSEGEPTDLMFFDRIYNSDVVSNPMKDIDDRILGIILDGNDDNSLSPENVKDLSNKIAAEFLQRILGFKFSLGLIAGLEENGFSWLVSEYRHALYFPMNFDDILYILLERELEKINSTEFFHFIEKGKIPILDLGEKIEDIVGAIKEMFYERYGADEFNVLRLSDLGIQGFGYDDIVSAKEEANRRNDKNVIRI